MKFGARIKKLRKERNLLLQELGQRANLSAATLSLIERGKHIPTADTTIRLIDALEKGGPSLDDKIRNELFQALEKDRVEKERQPKESLAFGAALRDLLERLNLSGSDFTSRPRSTIHAIVSGVLLPSDALLVEGLIPEIKNFGASDTDLQPLYLAFLHDILAKSLRLQFLPHDKQKELLTRYMQQSRAVLSPVPDRTESPAPAGSKKRRFKNL